MAQLLASNGNGVLSPLPNGQPTQRLARGAGTKRSGGMSAAAAAEALANLACREPAPDIHAIPLHDNSESDGDGEYKADAEGGSNESGEEEGEEESEEEGEDGRPAKMVCKQNRKQKHVVSCSLPVPGPEP